MSDSAKVRLVRCPKCQNLLPELADYSVYQCGGCGAVLRAKHKGYVSGSLSDEGKVGGDSGILENSLEKGLVDRSGPSRDDNQRDVDKVDNMDERFQNQSKDIGDKGVFDVDVNGNKDEVDKTIGREQEEVPKSQIGHENGSKFSGRISDWKNGERSEMEGFWRRPRADMESVRFSTSRYPDEGPSNGYSSFSSNYMEPWRSHKEADGASMVQHLEQDRAELLRKLDELKVHLSKSSEMVNNQKEKMLPDERIIPPDPHPYGGSDPWFSDGSSGLNRTSRQFFGTDKHVAGSTHFNYHHEPYSYTSGHDMPMPNFPPSMHNPNRYGDPFASQMLRRGPHQFPQQPVHPYYPGRYVDTNPDSYELYAHNAMLHPPSCSCFHCYDNKRRGSVPSLPASFINSRFPDTPNDPMLYHPEIPGAFGPHIHNSRTAIPPVTYREKNLHARWASDFNSEMGSFVRSRPRKVMLASSSQRCYPVAGGSPFISCHNCFELLLLPKKALVLVKNHQQKVQCGACSSEISFAVINKKLVISPNLETKGVPSRGDNSSNEVVSSRMSHSRGHVNRTGANFSSDDYSGYDFHSVDREPLSQVALNSRKSREMQSFHSSSLSTSEDENSPEAMIAPREATKSINQPTTDSLSSPPAGSPLQEYFDYTNNNNHAVNRFGKGNQSSRSEQEKTKVDKMSSRQSSLKEAALATEMDVHDYSHTGVSQDSGDASREHDHPRSNRGGESFFVNIIKKSFRDFSRSNHTDDRSKINVTVNGQPLSDRVVKKAEKLAGTIQPGNYWYDFRAGFWGVMGGPCLGIIPPFIEEFNHPLPDKCSGGNTGVFVNGRELHQKDMDLLAGRGLPTDRDRSYIVEISGRVLDEDTGEELDSLGKLAPTVEKVKHGFGMKPPRAAT
ncbi:Protein ENHANCED DISEASE RESISTANCE 4, partial [Mucuna pruriens]